jgi:23S rRNA pseudouridine2605 synthase
VTATRRIGLARALSKLGHCSRSQATILIRAGAVTINGHIERDPEAPIRLERDRIGVEGEGVREKPKLYIAVNKPRGIVSTASDEQGRRTVYDLLAPDLPWVGPVGRLDKASEGLLLLTNDSEWAARISNPANHVPKTYHVQIDRVAEDQLLEALIRGITDRGEALKAKAARLLRHGQKHSWIEITLDEGKNRQIRRMLEALGASVLRLVRVSIGPVGLGTLAKGDSRTLTDEEKSALDGCLGRAEKPAGPDALAPCKKLDVRGR